jgi:hypothetical protein
LLCILATSNTAGAPKEGHRPFFGAVAAARLFLCEFGGACRLNKSIE